MAAFGIGIKGISQKGDYCNFKTTPKAYEIFSAFKLTSYKDCKVVILGQDPYHGENQAHGLAFSVKKGVALPPLK